MNKELLEETGKLMVLLQTTPPVDPASIEAPFTNAIKNLINAIQDVPEIDQQAEIEKLLQALLRAFFTHGYSWTQTYMVALRSKIKDSQSGAAAKKEVWERGKELQSRIAEFALCEYRLNCSIARVRREIEVVRGERLKQGFVPEKIEWTPDIEPMMARSKKVMREIEDIYRRLDTARPSLKNVEPLLSTIEAKIEELVGKQKLIETMRSFISSLRVGNFARARKFIKELTDTSGSFLSMGGKDQLKKEIAETGRQLIEFFEKRRADFTGSDNKLYLRDSEIQSALDVMTQEHEKARLVVEKYRLPEIEYRLQSIYRLRDKLSLSGSIDSLVSLHSRMFRGMILSLNDIKDVRAFESNIVEKVKYLIAGQLQELPSILSRAIDLMNNSKMANISNMPLAAVMATPPPETIADSATQAV